MVASSLIHGARYWPDTCALELCFEGGRRYLYLVVPQSVVDGFSRAASKGAYFNRVIKGQYDCHPLKDDARLSTSRVRDGRDRGGRAPLRAALRRSIDFSRSAAND